MSGGRECGVVMALKENRCYGLTGGKLSVGGNVSVFHVKLTDSAARAVGAFHSSKVGSCVVYLQSSSVVDIRSHISRSTLMKT